MSANNPCQGNNITKENGQLSSPTGSTIITPKLWKKRDSIRSRDSGIRRADSSKSKYFDLEIQTDSNKPPQPSSRPPNPKGSCIPSNQLQTPFVNLGGNINPVQMVNRKLVSASGSQRRKKLDSSLNNDDIGEKSFIIKKKMLMEQLVEGEAEGSTIKKATNKQNITLKGDRFVSIKETIAAYREVEQVLLVENYKTNTKPPLLISTNDGINKHPWSLRQSNSEERLQTTMNKPQAAKNYRRMWNNKATLQPPLDTQTLTQKNQNKENSLNSSSSTSAATPLGNILTSYLPSPSTPLQHPRVNNINVFRIKKQTPNNRNNFNQNGENQNQQFCIERRLSLKNEIFDFQESNQQDDQRRQCGLHKIPYSTKEQSNKTNIDFKHRNIFSKCNIEGKQLKLNNKNEINEDNGRIGDVLLGVKIGGYDVLKLQKSKQNNQRYGTALNFSKDQKSLVRDSDHCMLDDSLTKENITQDDEIEPSTALSEDDMENSCLYKNNEDETVNLMNCSQIYPIFWRQQTLDQSKEDRSDWGSKKVLVIKADSLIFGSIVSSSFWETSQGLSYFEQFSGKLNELKKSLRTLHKHYLIFFLFSSNSSRIIDLVIYMSKNLFLFDGAYYYTSPTAIYSNKAININPILTDFSISNPRNILFFDSVPTGFTLSQARNNYHDKSKSLSNHEDQNEDNSLTHHNSKNDNDSFKSKGILRGSIHFDSLNEWIPRIQGGTAKRTRVIFLRNRVHSNVMLFNLKKIVEIALQFADPRKSSRLKLMELDVNGVVEKAIEEGIQNMANNNFLKQINKIKQNNKNSFKDDQTPLDADKVAESFRNRLIEYMKSTQKSIHSLYYLVGDLVVRNRNIFQNYCQEPFHCRKRNINNLQQLDYLRNAVLYNSPKPIPSKGKFGKENAKLLEQLQNENPYDILLTETSKKEVEAVNLPIKFYMYIDHI